MKKTKRRNKNKIILGLSVAVVLLTVLLIISIFSFGKSKKSDSGIMNSLAEAQNEIFSYKDELSQKNSEIESYTNVISEQNSIHESEKEELNKKISDLNSQVSLKKKQQADNAAANASTPEPAPSDGGSKTIYLTFDDGPSPNTPRIISILNSYGIKATFFVKNTAYNGYMKDIVDNGNTIALHSYTHDYKQIYSSDEAFYEDLQNISDLVYLQTGVRSNIMRFPGGGSNTVSKKYSQGIMSRLTKGVQDRGYVYYDWNCSSGDASGNKIPKDTIVENCKKVPSASNVIVLLHDTGAKGTTVDALPEVIEYYLSCGYTFKAITADTPPVHHKVNN